MREGRERVCSTLSTQRTSKARSASNPSQHQNRSPRSGSCLSRRHESAKMQGSGSGRGASSLKKDFISQKAPRVRGCRIAQEVRSPRRAGGGLSNRTVNTGKRFQGSKEANRKETRRKKETPHFCYGGLEGVGEAAQENCSLLGVSRNVFQEGRG